MTVQRGYFKSNSGLGHGEQVYLLHLKHNSFMALNDVAEIESGSIRQYSDDEIEECSLDVAHSWADLDQSMLDLLDQLFNQG